MTIHRIQVPPALDARTTGELADNLERAAAQSGGVILLAGAGGTFCRGMDFTAVLAAEDAGTLEAECARSVAAFVECVWLIRSCGKPVVAVVNGETLAGGVGLVAASDLVVATERSTFGMSETLFGLVPAITLPILRERMTLQKARLVIMTGRSYSATEAQAMGLVDVVTSADALDQTVRAHVRSLARAAPDAGAPTATGWPAGGQVGGRRAGHRHRHHVRSSRTERDVRAVRSRAVRRAARARGLRRGPGGGAARPARRVLERRVAGAAGGDPRRQARPRRHPPPESSPRRPGARDRGDGRPRRRRTSRPLALCGHHPHRPREHLRLQLHESGIHARNGDHAAPRARALPGHGPRDDVHGAMFPGQPLRGAERLQLRAAARPGPCQGHGSRCPHRGEAASGSRGSEAHPVDGQAAGVRGDPHRGSDDARDHVRRAGRSAPHRGKPCLATLRARPSSSPGARWGSASSPGSPSAATAPGAPSPTSGGPPTRTRSAGALPRWARPRPPSSVRTWRARRTPRPSSRACAGSTIASRLSSPTSRWPS